MAGRVFSRSSGRAAVDPLVIDEFVQVNDIDEMAACQLREADTATQRKVLDRRGLTDCRKPSSAVWLARMRNAKSMFLAKCFLVFVAVAVIVIIVWCRLPSRSQRGALDGGSSRAVNDSELWALCADDSHEGDDGSQACSLAATRRTWAMGRPAYDEPVLQLATDLQLRWTREAEQIVRNHFMKIQFSPQGCAESVRVPGFISAQVNMHWGMGSSLRDVGNQLLFGLLRRQMVVWDSSTFIDPGGFGACVHRRFWLESCFFKNFSACQSAYEHGLMGKPALTIPNTGGLSSEVARNSSWFLRQSQVIWDELLASGAISYHSCGGKAVLLEGELVRRFLSGAGADFEHAQRLSMLRSLLLRVAFRPNDALEQQTGELVAASRLGSLRERGPMVALHVRRTDKKMDFRGKGVESHLAESGTGHSVGNFQRLIGWLERTAGPASSFFLMSDDPRTFQKPVYETLESFFMNSAIPRSQSFTSASELLLLDDAALDAGHETWPHKEKLYRDVLAEAFAVGRYADYIVGCGSAGITQLIAQLIGGRVGVDPNLVGLWEDDHILEQFVSLSASTMDL